MHRKKAFSNHGVPVQLSLFYKQTCLTHQIKGNNTLVHQAKSMECHSPPVALCQAWTNGFPKQNLLFYYQQKIDFSSLKFKELGVYHIGSFENRVLANRANLVVHHFCFALIRFPKIGAKSPFPQIPRHHSVDTSGHMGVYIHTYI